MRIYTLTKSTNKNTKKSFKEQYYYFVDKFFNINLPFNAYVITELNKFQIAAWEL